ncbi:MAG: HAD-IA family hydrolase [Chloroflexi bacterium]|nr:HAD-IA family hydrolase [Chloroflexota bacterium]
MIKAVFFDWFNTLARYRPAREEIQSQALRESGILAPPEKLTRSILVADREWFDENAVSPIRKRSQEEQARIYARYQKTLLTEAGIAPPETDTFTRIMKRVRELSRALEFALFDDVLPALKTLKERNLTLGLLSNMDRDVAPLCQKLGLEPYLSFAVTSGEVGADKPEPPIFLAALERAGVEATQAIHVGDQYKIDVDGARRVNIKPLLLDRNDLYPEVKDCPRIHSLSEVVEYV